MDAGGHDDPIIDPDPAGPDPVATSAQGWQRIQLAVLGFIGFCGVMWAGGSSSAPEWAQWLAGVLAVSAFGLALLAIYLVGTAAYPVLEAAGSRTETAPATAARRLRAGIRLTYVAVAVIVAATLTAWWPGAAQAAGAVEVRASGSTWCGELVAGPPEMIRLDTADGVINVQLAAITHVAPVNTC